MLILVYKFIYFFVISYILTLPIFLCFFERETLNRFKNFIVDVMTTKGNSHEMAIRNKK